MTNIIWESTLDKQFQCVVERINKRGGHLKVYNIVTEEVLMEQDVGLMYGAQFGPDVEDVEKWQSVCIAVVDRYLSGKTED